MKPVLSARHSKLCPVATAAAARAAASSCPGSAGSPAGRLWLAWHAPLHGPVSGGTQLSAVMWYRHMVGDAAQGVLSSEAQLLSVPCSAPV